MAYQGSMDAAPVRAGASREELLRDGALQCAYQPLVDLDTGRVPGHEALPREAAGTAWGSSMVLLEAAGRADNVHVVGEITERTLAADPETAAAHAHIGRLAPRTEGRG